MARHPNNNYRRSNGFRRPQQRRNRKRGNFAAEVLGLSLFAGVVTWQVAPHVERMWSQASKTPEVIAAVERSAYYSGCDDARAVGVAPIYRGQPGYREGMDGDLDGIACKPYR
jgi:hypothetical protein